ERADPLPDAAVLSGDDGSFGARRASRVVRSRWPNASEAGRGAGGGRRSGCRTYIYGSVRPCRSDTAGGQTNHLPRRSLVRAHAGRGGQILARVLACTALLVLGCSSVGDSRGLPSDRSASVVYVALGDSTVEGIGATSKDRNYVSRLLANLRAIYPN